jgi:hypothetical protein
LCGYKTIQYYHVNSYFHIIFKTCMRFEISVTGLIISLIIGTISFFSQEYTVWFVFLIILIISVIGIVSSRKKSKPNKLPEKLTLDVESTEKGIPVQNTKNTTGMASFTGELQDFYDIILPKIRNSIASMTKKKKIELGYICQHCNQKNELDSAHKQGRSLRDIVKNVLEHYKSENGVYVVSDLNQLILKIKGEHIPIENSFLFLCKECHRKYDGKTTNNKEELHVTPPKDKPIKEIKKVKNTEHLGIIPQKGEEFTEKELYEQYTVRNSGGIRPSTKNKVIILINSFFSENQGGYENETSGKSGFVYHVGEGEGDQEMKRNNKSIFETQYNGYSMLYFDKPEQNRLFFRFKVEYDSHELERQTNSEGEDRDVIIFKLKIIN